MRAETSAFCALMLLGAAILLRSWEIGIGAWILTVDTLYASGAVER